MNNVKVDLGGDVGNAGLFRGDRAVSQHFEQIWILATGKGQVKNHTKWFADIISQ